MYGLSGFAENLNSECTKLRKLNEKVCTELRKELAIMKGGLPFQVGPSLLYIPDQVGPNAHS